MLIYCQRSMVRERGSLITFQHFNSQLCHGIVGNFYKFHRLKMKHMIKNTLCGFSRTHECEIKVLFRNHGTWFHFADFVKQKKTIISCESFSQ